MCLAALAVAVSCNVCSAKNFTVMDREPNAKFLYMDRMDARFAKSGAYNVQFSADRGSNKLYITDGVTRNIYFVLKPYEDCGVAYDVTEIPVGEAHSGLFAVAATAGAHAQNLGYWLIGVTNGEWKIYVDYTVLAKQGMNPEDWCRIYSKPNGYTGIMEISRCTEYMPPWGKISADLINMETNRWTCIWNDDMQNFQLKAIAVEKPAFIDSQDKAAMYVEHFVKNSPRFGKYLENDGKIVYSRHNPNPNDGLENHEIKIIEDTPTHINTRATFIINEVADILYYDVVMDKYEKVN